MLENDEIDRKFDEDLDDLLKTVEEVIQFFHLAKIYRIPLTEEMDSKLTEAILEVLQVLAMAACRVNWNAQRNDPRFSRTYGEKATARASPVH